MAAGLNKKADAIRNLVEHRLKSVARTELLDASAGAHIDEDTIAAFIEGRLAETECKPVLAHLAACGLCRRVSAQFVRLENQIDAEPATGTADEEPGRLEALLSTFGSVVASNEEVVFAYQNPSEDDGSKDSAVPRSKDTKDS
jgi:hypothetical protein